MFVVDDEVLEGVTGAKLAVALLVRAMDAAAAAAAVAGVTAAAVAAVTAATHAAALRLASSAS